MPTNPGRLERILAYIDQHLGDPLPLAQLASLADLSVWRFSTVFRQRMGLSPRRYINRQRVQRAQALLREGLPVACVAGEAGFYDQSHLSRHFKNVCGMTPGQYMARMRTGGRPRRDVEQKIVPGHARQRHPVPPSDAESTRTRCPNA